ncbi:hypothetical protein SAMN05444673_6138 [Bacillus sp. OV166]|uniref:hypothetical protein n=1 Tax=Bacillus sp. OV166 TaxID=1882763 RepID=UPI000A2ABBB3|nr:hypothetical protein [Bacillus sp. OV166]SMQ84876.1 hypothetical protein SAMN05444673_6138 [Bacillus sp. OV166]
MIKITKGALAMVLAGSVTFSVANALLGQPIKQLTKEIALPISADRKKADVINPAEKKDKPQTPAANVKDRPVFKVSLKNRNTNDTAVAAVQQNREKSSDRTTTSVANPRGTTTTKPVAKTIPVKSTKAPTTTSKSTTTRTAAIRTTTKPAAPTIPATSAKAPTTATTPTTSKTSTTTTKTNKTTSATTTKTNRGQQVSQAAKEKAASQSNKKENNGKKM